jgi:hypothetical protein
MKRNPVKVKAGRKGGRSRSPAKVAAARANGRLGGRPPKPKRCRRCRLLFLESRRCPGSHYSLLCVAG